MSTRDERPATVDSPPDLLAARAGATRPGGFFDLPGVRKFVRNRVAVFALAVIAVFFAAALAVGIPPGVVSMEAVTERVGPGKVPGLGAAPPMRDRIDHADRLLSEADKALEASDPGAALQRLGFAELRVFSTDPAAVAERLDRAWEVFDELDALLAEQDDLMVEADDAVREATEGDVAAAARAAALRDEARALDGAVEGALREVEAACELIYPRPEGGAYGLRVLLGTDAQGRSIFLRAVYSVKTAVQIGFVTAVLSVVVGGLLGAAAGYFGGWVDHAVVWVYSTVSAIPYLIWLIVIAFVVRESGFEVPVLNKPIGQTLIPVYIAFVLTFWVGPCRVVRGEAMKIKGLDYVQSAVAVGAGPWRILLRHVLPNTMYLLFINFSLLFVGAIKAEVILSFLGLGVQGQPSWGIMIRDSKDEVITGFFWQIGTATGFMFLLVLAFNIVSDALQDAFDPKHVG